MYHYITLGDTAIYMTGVGILLFIIVFIATSYYYSRKHKLDFRAFSTRLPRYLVFLYAIGQYSWYLLQDQVWFPMSTDQILLYLSPYGYSFHIAGIIIGIVIIWQYMKRYQVKDIQKQYAWLHTFLHAFTLASIPLGIFLLLGDNFIGMSTDKILYVSAIRSDSNMAVYGKVLPLGLFLSALGLVVHLLHNLVHAYKHKHQHTYTYTHRIYLFYAFFSLGLLCILLFQQYPRHLVSTIAGITFDIKQYILGLVTLGFLRQYLRSYWRNKKTKTHIEPGTYTAQQQQQ